MEEANGSNWVKTDEEGKGGGVLVRVGGGVAGSNDERRLVIVRQSGVEQQVITVTSRG